MVRLCFCTFSHHLDFNLNVALVFSSPEGLQATAAEQVIPKVPGAKKKGKKSGARSRPAKLTNTHLRDMGIDLSKDYVAPGK